MIATQLQPIQRTVEAKPHRPVYRMHRYFARRPYSVFAELVRHYSKAGEVILDPFCGGGVTIVEGILQNRRAIGFDINPLAAFISRMEVQHVDLSELNRAQGTVVQTFKPVCDRIFATVCRKCAREIPAQWFEYSAVKTCSDCGFRLVIAKAKKTGASKWECNACGNPQTFSPDSSTIFDLLDLFYSCNYCGSELVVESSELDKVANRKIEAELVESERAGLWIPTANIPDCNMQRESALFKKGIVQFRQFFTPRHLLALAQLRQQIIDLRDPMQEWLLFAFSSTLRYTNRMVTRNPVWRGQKPFEWSKPGFWMPPVHLEANVLEQFLRRFDAIVKGKEDFQSRLSQKPTGAMYPQDVLAEQETCLFHLSQCSATRLPLPSESIDTVITDPPYGSYVHYADLTNFWSVWLPEIGGLGKVIDDSEEAVIARKSFPGAKTARDYQKILEGCFRECFRVLKTNRYMVLTFHNREPRAWASLLTAAVKAGFGLPEDGVIFQDGIPSYRHTAQSRRSGSVIGDFIFSFVKNPAKQREHGRSAFRDPQAKPITEQQFLDIIKVILNEHGPLTPDILMREFYVAFLPLLLTRVRIAVGLGEDAVADLISHFDSIDVFNSHQRQLLEEHFSYRDGKWSNKSD